MWVEPAARQAAMTRFSVPGVTGVVKIYSRTSQLFRGCDIAIAVDYDLRSHRAEPVNVYVYRSESYCASARVHAIEPAESSEQRSRDKKRRAHFGDERGIGF